LREEIEGSLRQQNYRIGTSYKNPDE